MEEHEKVRVERGQILQEIESHGELWSHMSRREGYEGNNI